MFFNKKNDATASKKKNNPLAPAFRYPKVKHRESSLVPQETPAFLNDVDFFPNNAYSPLDLNEPVPTDVAEVEALTTPSRQESARFNGQEAPPPTLEELTTFLPTYAPDVATNAPTLFPPEAEASPTYFLEEDDEIVVKQDAIEEAPQSLAHEVESTPAVESFSLPPQAHEEQAFEPLVFTPPVEPLPPIQEPPLQARTLAFEDDEHYYNPLAIGEVLPSFHLAESLAESPVESLAQIPAQPLEESFTESPCLDSPLPVDVFDDLHNLDLDLKESFAVAQKSSEALETILGDRLEEPTVVEDSSLLQHASEETPSASPEPPATDDMFDMSLFLEQSPQTTEDPAPPHWVVEEEQAPTFNEESVERDSFFPTELEPTPHHLNHNLNHTPPTALEAPPLNDVSFPLDAEEEDPFETLPVDVHPEEAPSLELSFNDFCQLEEGDAFTPALDASSSNHFAIESEDALEDAAALVDPHLFFSLEGLEDGTAPEAICLDLEPAIDVEIPDATSPFNEQSSSTYLVPPTKENDLTHQLIHPIETAPLDAFDAFAEESKVSKATLGEYATLALEDLEVLISRPFPCGESHLYLVHVNSVYAIIAFKQAQYTLLHSFSNLPEGVCQTGSAEAPQIAEEALQLTWNASSYNEHVFNVQFGSWQALVVEDATRINVL